MRSKDKNILLNNCGSNFMLIIIQGLLYLKNNSRKTMTNEPIVKEKAISLSGLTELNGPYERKYPIFNKSVAN